MREAVAAETAIVDEKKILKILIRFNRRLPKTASPRDNRMVVGTVYSTNWPDLVKLFRKVEVEINRSYWRNQTNAAGLPIGSVRYRLSRIDWIRGMNVNARKMISEGARNSMAVEKFFICRRWTPDRLDFLAG
jgi:hypothetical protein